MNKYTKAGITQHTIYNVAQTQMHILLIWKCFNQQK